MLPVEADDKMYMKKKARMFDMTSLSVDGVNLPVRVVVFQLGWGDREELGVYASLKCPLC